MTAYANVNGESVIEGVLYVPNVGPWWADVIFEGSPDVSGAVTLSLGDLALSGTIAQSHDGVFGEQRRSRIVAGAGGWSTQIAAQHYHSDGLGGGGGGVRALEVAEDAARLAGEQLGSFSPENETIGVDYVRQAGLASRALEGVIGNVAWHVGYDGITNVGNRVTAEADPEHYEVLDQNPRAKLTTLAIDDFSKVGIGSILSQGLDDPVTIFEMEVRIGVDSSRTVVWSGGSVRGRGRLAGSLRRIVEAVSQDRLFGKYRYRVVSMDGIRVELQSVSQASGLPDIVPVSQKPGVSGAHAALAGGSIVLVEFIEGDRTMPLVVAFAGKGEEGHAPDELDFSVGTTLRLGGDSATEGVLLGDSFKSWADAHQHEAGSMLLDGMGATVTGITGGPATAPGVPDPSPDPSERVKVL